MHDHDRHDKAIGVKGESIQSVLSKSKLSRHLMRSDLHRILTCLDKKQAAEPMNDEELEK